MKLRLIPYTWATILETHYPTSRSGGGMFKPMTL